MRRLLPLILLALVVALAHPQAQSSAAENRVIGTSSGSYSGDGNGSLTSTNAEGESFMSTFKTVVVDGAKLSITYDTGDEGGEVNPRVSSMLPAL
jgi:hypothetical protein